MCVVSMIGDDWNRNFPNNPNWPNYPATTPNNISRAEFEVWKKNFDDEVKRLTEELEALKNLLRAAKIYDDTTGQPDCEQDEKIELFKRLGEMMGVDFSDVLDSKQSDGE